MIIPIKCFTCGKVLADKYLYYLKEVRKKKNDLDIKDEIAYFNDDNVKKSVEAIVLDNLNITKICCRRHMLTHVDI